MQNFLKIDTKKTTAKICDFLKKEFKQKNKNIAVIGISGGIDSAVSAFLCKKADLEIYGVILPYHKKGIQDSLEVTKALELLKNHIKIIDIGKSVDAQVKELQKVIELDQGDKGNIMARQRMIFEYALAKKLNGLVVGTENLSEYYLGYFTLHGDQACDISPITGLLKNQIYQIAQFLKISESVIKKIPTAGLWQGQTDEKELGFSYENADKIIYLSIIKKYPYEKIIQEFGISKKILDKVLKKINDTEYKRNEPPNLRIKNLESRIKH